MINSQEPWSTRGNQLLDALGNVIATFNDWHDAERVIEAMNRERNEIDDLLDQQRELEQQMENISNDAYNEIAELRKVIHKLGEDISGMARAALEKLEKTTKF